MAWTISLTQYQHKEDVQHMVWRQIKNNMQIMQSPLVQEMWCGIPPLNEQLSITLKYLKKKSTCISFIQIYCIKNIPVLKYFLLTCISISYLCHLSWFIVRHVFYVANNVFIKSIWANCRRFYPGILASCHPLPIWEFM